MIDGSSDELSGVRMYGSFSFTLVLYFLLVLVLTTLIIVATVKLYLRLEHGGEFQFHSEGDE